MKASLILVALLGVAFTKKHDNFARPIRYTEINLLDVSQGVVKHKKRRIYDEDGDGVEDNVEKTWDELDRFYDPLSFGDAEEINNTHHGNLPGHIRLEEYEGAPETHYGKLV